MPLSARAREFLKSACGDENVAKEVADALDAATAAQQSKAAAVVFAAGANLAGVDGTGSNAAPLAGTETRLDALDTAVAAIIANMQSSGQMAT